MDSDGEIFDDDSDETMSKELELSGLGVRSDQTPSAAFQDQGLRTAATVSPTQGTKSGSNAENPASELQENFQELPHGLFRAPGRLHSLHLFLVGATLAPSARLGALTHKQGSLKRSKSSKIDSEHSWRFVAMREAQLLLCASALSLAPVIMPFGDPYDISVTGYLKNTGYFVWYCVTGWGSLWLAQLVWARALLGLPQEGMLKAAQQPRILVPTLFSVLIFFLLYVLLGGPFPMGTLILGMPCFLVSWACLWRWEVKSSAASQSSEDRNPGAGLRAVGLFLFFMFQLVVYSAATCLIMRFPAQRDVFAVVFVLGEALLDAVGDIEEFLYGESVRVRVPDDVNVEQQQGDADDIVCPARRTTKLLEHAMSSASQTNASQPTTADGQFRVTTITYAQQTACRLFFPLWFRSLHMTYMNFLFPVLTDFHTVLVACAAKFLKSCYDTRKDLEFSDLFKKLSQEVSESDSQHEISRLKRVTAGIMEKQFFSRRISFFVDITSPALFGVLFAFNLYGWNEGMFYISVGSGNSTSPGEGNSTIGVDSDQAKDVEKAEVFGGLCCNFGVAILNLIVYTLVLYRLCCRKDRAPASNQVAPGSPNVATSTQVGANANAAADQDPERNLLWRKIESETLQKALKDLNTRTRRCLGLKTVSEAAAEAAAAEKFVPPPNFFHLVILTQGVVTTIVGVCMVMKHDGMDIEGVMNCLFEDKDFPYPLDPVWN